MDVRLCDIQFQTSSRFCSAELYRAIYQYVCRSPNIAELTVEDPAEAFEDLRDKCDLQMLLLHERFLEEAFGAESETSRVRKSGRADRESEVLSSSDKVTTAEVAGQGRLGPPANKAWVVNWRKDLKIASVCRLPLFSWLLV